MPSGLPALLAGPLRPMGSRRLLRQPQVSQKMNRGAVSQLLVTTIYRSQPGVLAKAHDVRKASATFTWARGVPPHQIIQTMFWKSTSVFLDKYLVPPPDRPIRVFPPRLYSPLCTLAIKSIVHIYIYLVYCI